VYTHWIKGHLNPWWTTEHRNLPFTNEPFNNSEDLDRWKSMGYTHTKYTGDMYDMRNTEPKWFDMDRIKHYFDFEHLSWSFYRMTTGVVLPEHVDTFNRFKELYDCNNKVIVRALIMLEDWKQGHYLDFDGLNMNTWKAGDYIIWEEHVPHTAANIGKQNRYTLQLTGLIDQRLVDWEWQHN